LPRFILTNLEMDSRAAAYCGLVDEVEQRLAALPGASGVAAGVISTKSIAQEGKDGVVAGEIGATNSKY
jgi:hypothetical protein